MKVGFSTETKKRNLLFVKKFDTIGDGSGSISQNVDGSTIPVVFKVAPASNEIYLISRIIFLIRDNATFDSGGWGALGGTPLTNGCVLSKKLNGVQYAAFNLKSNADIAGICFDISKNSWGAGDEFLSARFTFTKLGDPIRLIGANGDEIIFTINDNLTGLVDQYVVAEGMYENKKY